MFVVVRNSGGVLAVYASCFGICTLIVIDCDAVLVVVKNG